MIYNFIQPPQARAKELKMNMTDTLKHSPENCTFVGLVYSETCL